MLKVRGGEFDLPIIKDSYDQFVNFVDKSFYTGCAGVYVYTHKVFYSKYIG